MSKAKKQHTWNSFLKFYSEQNMGRKTRLGVFENGNDYWIEDGLLLNGIDFDLTEELPNIQIMLGDEMVHNIPNVRNAKFMFNFDGLNDGIDFVNTEGTTTILRFED